MSDLEQLATNVRRFLVNVCNQIFTDLNEEIEAGVAPLERRGGGVAPLERRPATLITAPQSSPYKTPPPHESFPGKASDSEQKPDAAASLSTV